MYKNELSKNLFLCPGAMHIHSKYSDGTGDIEEITKAARKAGLLWILISDHNNMKIKEGIYNGIYVIVGEEISPRYENHYLALNIKDKVEPSENPKTYIEAVRNQGGFGFAAHPDESNERRNKAKPIKWSDKSINTDGIEIWNWFSDWADNYDDTNILKTAYAYFFRHKLIKGPQEKTLTWWDDLNIKNEKIIPAIAGVDAHALKVSKYIIPLKIFPYEYCFKTLNNLLILENQLSDNFEEAKENILNSIKYGKNIIINKMYSKSKNLPIFVISNNENQANCGESINLTENTYLYINLFQNASIKILRNGKNFYSTISNQVNLKIEKPGKYRFEAKYKNNPWIYSNPIFVK